MARTETNAGGYLIAAALGALGGGLAVALASKGLPKMLAEVKGRLHEACGEACDCLAEEAVEEAPPVTN